ncbi:MAG: site-2 protease family protein [Sedimentisphaerales bacterium]|nr:site-2 protease family protein [Sedimentisphaerales bacterium]
MSKPESKNSKSFRIGMFIVCLIAIIIFIVKYIGAFINVLLVMLGFGAVILVHEFGHFIIAKISNIKVEAFSIFMPPILFGVQRTEKGIKFRILPEIFPKEDDETGEGALSFTIPKKCKPGETEYRIGLIPFGGFVKMLGQDDIGAVKNNNDPRSFANKPAHIRAAVIAAGVCFNVISAVIIFMIAFLVGIQLQPAKVGSVVPGSPAAIAGIKPGDEIVEIAGKYKDLDFSDIGVAAALSGKDEDVLIKVEHPGGGDPEEYRLKAVMLPGEQMRLFGISPANSLTVAKLSKEEDANDLYIKTGLRPGDRIVSVNDREIRGYWEMEEIVNNLLESEVTLTFARTENDKEVRTLTAQIPLYMNTYQTANTESGIMLCNIYSMVPRLKIAASGIVPDSMESGAENKGLPGKVSYLFVSLYKKIAAIFSKKEPVEKPEHPLHPGDIILAIGEIENPTYNELTEIAAEYKDKELPVKVLRKDENGNEQELTVIVTPKQPAGSKKVLIGIIPSLDAEHPVVTQSVDVGNYMEKLSIPRGAVITAVDGKQVNSFYDIIREIRKYPGEKITLEWRIDKQTAGNASIDVKSDDSNLITVRSSLAENIPFEVLKELYKADGPIHAIVMGYRRTVSFIAQTYVTLRRLVTGLVSPDNLMGPVGIMRISYRIVADQPPVYYVYFLGLINAVIAVFNFLPVPPLDGGLVLLLIIEKIKGSAISERTQTIIAYTTWTLILALVIYVTFNDLTRTM